jgi:hypothetical protein
MTISLLDAAARAGSVVIHDDGKKRRGQMQKQIQWQFDQAGLPAKAR